MLYHWASRPRHIFWLLLQLSEEKEWRYFWFENQNWTNPFAVLVPCKKKVSKKVEYESLLNVKQILGTECLHIFIISPLLLSRYLYLIKRTQQRSSFNIQTRETCWANSRYLFLKVWATALGWRSLVKIPFLFPTTLRISWKI